MKNFNFKKKFGQNFLTDKNLLSSICADAEIGFDDQVLEIGAGMGALTVPLCERASKVVSYEIDNELQPHLLGLGFKNLTLHFEDALEKPLNDIEKDFDGEYKLVANLPYYITSPLIFKFLESNKLKSLTIMVQKEVGDRIVAKQGSKDYGVLSLNCAYFGQAKIMRKVPRQMFTPAPDVDSCIVRLDIEPNKYDLDKQTYFKLIKTAFKSRRKTLLNNLSEGLNVSKSALSGLDFDLSKRAEQLSIDDFVKLGHLLNKIIGEKRHDKR